MPRPSPFTLIVQMLSALMGGVWARLFLGRGQAAALESVLASLRALDELYAQWKAGKLVAEEGAGPEAAVAPARAVPAKREGRARTRRFRPEAGRRQEPVRRRIVRLRPVNWAVIPRRLGRASQRGKSTVARVGEWSG